MKKYILTAILLLSTILLTEAKNIIDFYANKAEESLGDGRFEDALDYARQEIKDYENNPNGYYQAALSLYALQQPGQSLSMLNKAIEKSNKNKPFAAKCFLAKSDLLNELGDSVQSLNALNEGLKVDGKNIDLLLERGLRLVGIDRKAALNDLQKARKLAPNEARVYINTAYLYTQDNKLNEALAEITRALAIDNTNAYSYGMRGLILKELGIAPDWIRDCIKSYMLDSGEELGPVVLALSSDTNTRETILNEIEQVRTSQNGLYNLEANLALAWDDFARASQVYEQMINLGIAGADTYYYLGECQKRLGFHLDAYTTASKGLTQYPDDSSLKLMKAQVGVIAGKGAQVMDILDELISQSPEADNLYVEKGKAYMAMGRYADAIEPFYTAVVLNPSALNKLTYGDALRLAGEATDAKIVYSQILQMLPEDISNQGRLPQYMYAMAHSGMGNKDAAVAAIKLLVNNNPEDAKQYWPLIFARLGLKNMAISSLEEYARKYKWNAFFDLNSYDFHVLHPEPAFVKLLADNGVGTSYNNQTHLLEYQPENMFVTSGGTSIDELTAGNSNTPREMAQNINAQCPIDLGIGGQIVGVDYDEQTATFTYNLIMNPLFFNFKFINNNPSYKEKKQEIMAMSLIAQAPLMANLEINLKYDIKSPDNTEHCSLMLSSAKLKGLKRKAQSQDEMDKMMLDFWIEEENLMFEESGQNAQSKLDGNAMVYSYLVNEDDGAFSQIEIFNQELKKQLSYLLKDPTMQARLPLLVRQNIILKFEYIGNTTGKKVDIIFTPEELSNYITPQY